GNPHAAKVAGVSVYYLKTVGIDQRDHRIFGDENPGMIDVPDDASGFMDGGYRFRGIDCGVGQKAVARARKMLLSGLGRVELEDRLVITHQVHDKAFKMA